MAEDFNKLRLLARKLVKTDFQKEWLFRLEIENEPADFDLYVKDISYGPVEITTDDDNCGSVTMTWPTARTQVRITATMRDDADARISKFIDAWCEKVVHSDGTVGLPYGADGYVHKVRVYNQSDNVSETLAGEWEMYAQSRGDISRSRENGGFLEFPVSFIQFSTATNSSIM